MSVEDKLQKLWQSKRTAPAPSKEELLKKAFQVQTGIRRKLIRSSVLLLLTSAWIIYVVAAAKPTMITTWIGTALALIAMFMFLFSSAGMMKMLNNNNHTDLPVVDYLQHMIQVREKQRFLQTTIMKLYILILSAGVCLYMIEYTRHYSTTVRLLILLLALGWMAFSWFILGKRVIKKQEAAITEVIDKLQSLAKANNNLQ
ncbi:hypothetical protein ACE38W_08510 [Chitinophaga sp. Hz27]|uniref:hypothetical protein n=1 Tax=Chitinophaga sp. Hz27 TaxID=3347169 RepID=UPI0035D7B62C